MASNRTRKHSLPHCLAMGLTLGLMLAMQGCGGAGAENSETPATQLSPAQHSESAILPLAQPTQLPPQETDTPLEVTPVASEPVPPSVMGDTETATQPQHPRLTYHPGSAAVFAGETHTFNVTATSTETLRYQWRRNGVTIPDAILPHLTLSAISVNDAGSYDVIISNSAGSVTSETAQLSVSIDRNASLSWETPVHRQDGTPLTTDDITGYRIYHSTEDGNLETHYDLDAQTTTLALSDLSSGNHFFAITAIDQTGLESELSNVVSKQIL